jgi:hypothetical protein
MRRGRPGLLAVSFPELHRIAKNLLHPIVARESANRSLPIRGVVAVAPMHCIAKRGNLYFKAFDPILKAGHIHLPCSWKPIAFNQF